MKRILIVLVLVGWALVGCDLPEPSNTPTPSPTASGDVTVEPLPTDTPIPPTGVTPLPTETPSPTVQAAYTERLQNGDFEEGFSQSWLEPYVPYGVADYWYPVVWRDFPNPRPCAEGQTEGCNPVFSTRTPEYKPSNAEIGGDPFRTVSGNGQQWFGAGELCHAGIGQDFSTTPGEYCMVSAWGMTWGSIDGRGRPHNEQYRSDIETEDDRDNMHLMLVINPKGEGIEFPFPDYYIIYDAGYLDGIYDEPDGGAYINLEFTAQAEHATVALIGYQLFPVGNANWYVDNVQVVCSGVPVAPVVDIDKPPTAIVPAPTVEPVESELPEVVTVEAQGLDSSISNEENEPMDTQVLLDILFVLLAGVAAFPAGSALGNLVSAVVDLVKAVLLLFGVELGEEWAGRAFVLVNFVAFVAVFLLAGVNPAEYVLPENVAAIVGMVVNVVLAVVGLLGAFNFGDLIHKALKAKAPTLFSATLRAKAQSSPRG